MTELPRHLTPWAKQLAIFPEELALALGGMAARLAALLGGWPAEEAAGSEPDGYRGIGRKGPYDRLLAAEWLLLDEVPDEFLRRAVSSEHLFLERAYQSGTAVRQCTLLFDAGPEQLGAPRVAQIALLVVLAERAARFGAEFRWGVFQDASGGAFHTGLKKSLAACRTGSSSRYRGFYSAAAEPDGPAGPSRPPRLRRLEASSRAVRAFD